MGQSACVAGKFPCAKEAFGRAGVAAWRRAHGQTEDTADSERS